MQEKNKQNIWNSYCLTSKKELKTTAAKLTVTMFYHNSCAALQRNPTI